MQVIEFKNEFHFVIDYGRFREFQKNKLRCVCKITEWEVSIFSGAYIKQPFLAGNILVDKVEKINVPFEVSRDTSKVVFKKYESVIKWHTEKKIYHCSSFFKPVVYQLGLELLKNKGFVAEHILIDDDRPEQVDVIPELADLTFEIPIKGTLREYQRKGVARGLFFKKFINGDMPGLGKTLQSIATLIAAEVQGNKPFPALVICPSSLKINWQREFEMWTGKTAVVLGNEMKSNYHIYNEVGKADVFITNYESLKKFFVAEMPKTKEYKSNEIVMDKRISIFKSVIIDEIHKLKNPKSIRAKIAINITRGKEFVIGLTGTPVVNKPIDLYAQLAIIGQLHKVGGINGFKTRYCEGGSGASNLKELNYLLNKNCFFRREKSEVLKDLPAKVRQKMICEISNVAEYNSVLADFTKFLKENDFSDIEIRKKMRSEALVKIMLLLQISARGKIEAAKEFIDEVIESGQKIVIFCKHKEVVNLLCEEYPTAVRVTGSENETQKQASVDAFQNNSETKIIIGSHKAAGVGLTLTAASEVLFVELPWTFADLEQCEDRCHRMGQKSSVRATALIGSNTIDNWLYDLINNKKAIADEVTGAEDVVPVNMIDSLISNLKK